MKDKKDNKNIFFKRGEPADSDSWMLTYSDMVTLMLTFFVVIVAISKIDPMLAQRMSQSMNKAMDKNKVEQVSIDELKKDVNEVIINEQLEEMVDVEVTARGVTISAKGAILFPSGSAELKESALPMLSKFANIIGEKEYNIAVEGHTDNEAISPSLARFYPSNWELSSARASSVVRYFIETGLPASRFRAVGYSDTEPIDSNDTPEGRASNRRIAIVFLVF